MDKIILLNGRILSLDMSLLQIIYRLEIAV